MHVSSGLYTWCLWIRDKCDNKHTTSVWRQIFISRVEQKRAWINISAERWMDDGNGGGGDDDIVVKTLWYPTVLSCLPVYLGFVFLLPVFKKHSRPECGAGSKYLPSLKMKHSISAAVAGLGREEDRERNMKRERETEVAGWKIPFRFRINESSMRYVC